MKKILNLGLIATAVLSFSAMATEPKPIELLAGAITEVAVPTNESQNIELEARPSRAGFVKNDFSITTSANVAISAIDDDTRFGVVAGSNRGRAVFTGTSEGGSVAQCGPLVPKNAEVKDGDLAGGASLVKKEGTLVLGDANGCGIKPKA